MHILTKRLLTILVPAALILGTFGLFATYVSADSYGGNHGQWSDQRGHDGNDWKWNNDGKCWDNDGHRCDGYWKSDGSWHQGMDGKSDNGSWDNDNCWREHENSKDDDKGGHSEKWNDQKDWNKKEWNKDKKNQYWYKGENQDSVDEWKKENSKDRNSGQNKDWNSTDKAWNEHESGKKDTRSGLQVSSTIGGIKAHVGIW